MLADGAASDASDLATRLRELIRDVPNFPRHGVVFKDVTTLLRDPLRFKEAVDALVAEHQGHQIDVVVGVESRGFVLGGVLAYLLGAGFVPVRKAGKLPGEKLSVEYTLEYGEAVLEIHRDAIRPGDKVLIVDDLLATGGTAAATVSLVEQLGGEIMSVAFLVQLSALGGGRQLGKYPYVALIEF